jgi:hypothetical protein
MYERKREYFEEMFTDGMIILKWILVYERADWIRLVQDSVQ